MEETLLVRFRSVGGSIWCSCPASTRARSAGSGEPVSRARAALERTALDRAAAVLERLFAHAPTAALRKLVDEASLVAVTGALSAAVAADPGADPLAGARARGVAVGEQLARRKGEVAPAGTVHATYRVTQVWSHVLWVHPDQPDGIRYRRRFDDDQHCIALFDRYGLALYD